MPFTDLSFSFGQTLTSAQMNQLQGNFAAMAAAESGAPIITGAAGGGLVLIDSLTASSSSTLEFVTGIDGTFDTYRLEFSSLIPSAAAGFYIRVSTDGGSTWRLGASDYVTSVSGGGSPSNTAFWPTGALSVSSTVSNSGLSGSVDFFSPDVADVLLLKSHVVLVDNGGTFTYSVGGGRTIDFGAAINGIQITFNGTTIASGDAFLYGLRKGV